MKGRWLTVVLMLLALAGACMITAPVISSEHPWDADGGGGPFDPNSPPPSDTIGLDENGQPLTGSPAWEWYWWYQIVYLATG